jgi:CDP-glucose 4,6-dehydratase
VVVSAFWRDRPTLVTGATGLLGGWLVPRLLAEGAEVVTIVRDWPAKSLMATGDWRDRVARVTGDVRNGALLERVLGEYEVRTVFHLAAQTIVGIANRNPRSTFATNVDGTWRLLEACRRSPLVEEVLVASSDKAYGDHGRTVVGEDAELKGRHPYDASKAAGDLIAQSYASTFQVPVAIARCGNFYGGGDLNWNRIVPGTIRSVLRGQRPVIRSDGTFVRDWLYVEDGASAYLSLAEGLARDPRLAGQAFNFSNEAPASVLDIVRTVLSAMGSGLQPDVRNESLHELPYQALSAAKARKVLGWKPSFTLPQGMERTIAWYRAHLEGSE